MICKLNTILSFMQYNCRHESSSARNSAGFAGSIAEELAARDWAQLSGKLWRCLNANQDVGRLDDCADLVPRVQAERLYTLFGN